MTQSSEASPLGAELGSTVSQSQPIVASNGHTEAERMTDCDHQWSNPAKDAPPVECIKCGAPKVRPPLATCLRGFAQWADDIAHGRLKNTGPAPRFYLAMAADLREAAELISAAQPRDQPAAGDKSRETIETETPAEISRLQHSLSLAVEALGQARALLDSFGPDDHNDAEFIKVRSQIREVHSSLTGGE